MRQSKPCLLEVIALNVRADFDQLNNALGAKRESRSTDSILSSDEQSDLFRLSYAISEAAKLCAAGLPIDRCYQQIIREALIAPSASQLDLVSSYRDLFADPRDWTRALPGHWAEAHKSRKTSPKAEDSSDIKCILTKALEAMRIQMRLGVPDPHNISYPVRRSYNELKAKLYPPQSRTHVWISGL